MRKVGPWWLNMTYCFSKPWESNRWSKPNKKLLGKECSNSNSSISSSNSNSISSSSKGRELVRSLILSLRMRRSEIHSNSFLGIECLKCLVHPCSCIQDNNNNNVNNNSSSSSNNSNSVNVSVLIHSRNFLEIFSADRMVDPSQQLTHLTLRLARVVSAQLIISHRTSLKISVLSTVIEAMISFKRSLDACKNNKKRNRSGQLLKIRLNACQWWRLKRNIARRATMAN